MQFKSVANNRWVELHTPIRWGWFIALHRAFRWLVLVDGWGGFLLRFHRIIGF